ncbi:hypothetical protein DL96DRAFT_1560839 [Flagelloscypha sp. PMI_526]|nr:hypothetical protein DL96DRAFT_1560839 [Flagelloscypha sp. PMI_526]
MNCLIKELSIKQSQRRIEGRIDLAIVRDVALGEKLIGNWRCGLAEIQAQLEGFRIKFVKDSRKESAFITPDWTTNAAKLTLSINGPKGAPSLLTLRDFRGRLPIRLHAASRTLSTISPTVEPSTPSSPTPRKPFLAELRVKFHEDIGDSKPLLSSQVLEAIRKELPAEKVDDVENLCIERDLIFIRSKPGLSIKDFWNHNESISRAVCTLLGWPHPTQALTIDRPRYYFTLKGVPLNPSLVRVKKPKDKRVMATFTNNDWLERVLQENSLARVDVAAVRPHFASKSKAKATTAPSKRQQKKDSAISTDPVDFTMKFVIINTEVAQRLAREGIVVEGVRYDASNTESIREMNEVLQQYNLSWS